MELERDDYNCQPYAECKSANSNSVLQYPSSLKSSFLLHYHKLKVERHGFKLCNDYAHNVWRMANSGHEQPRLALHAQQRDVGPALRVV